jgi:phosphate-selective porin OprO/OprP
MDVCGIATGMRRRRRVFVAALLLMNIAAGRPVLASEASGKFSKGLKFTSADGNFEFQAGGRIHFDYGMHDGDDDIGPLDDGLEFRRLRSVFSGRLYGNVDYKLQLEFAGSRVEYRDAYMGLRTAWFQVRAGQFHQPFGFETQSSSNYNTFIERSHPHALAPDRQSGLLLARALGDERGTIAVSLFQENSADGKNADTGYWSGAGRMTYVPIGGGDAEFLLHLGAAYANRRNAAQQLELELAPEAHLAPAFVEGALAAESWNQFGLEAALFRGPWCALGEAVYLGTAAPGGLEDGTITSYAAQLSCFVTGEQKAYKAATGLLDRVSPRQNYDGQGGKGALELALRFSATQTEDAAAAAGSVASVTVGANWHLNPQTRLMVNLLRSEGRDTPGLEGVVQAILTRLQIDF